MKANLEKFTYLIIQIEKRFISAFPCSKDFGVDS